MTTANGTDRLLSGMAKSMTSRKMSREFRSHIDMKSLSRGDEMSLNERLTSAKQFRRKKSPGKRTHTQERLLAKS